VIAVIAGDPQRDAIVENGHVDRAGNLLGGIIAQRHFGEAVELARRRARRQQNGATGGRPAEQGALRTLSTCTD